MKRILLIFFLLSPFIIVAQDFRVIDWKTNVLNVKTLAPDTFMFDAEPVDYNDIGAMNREIGNYFIDFAARCFEIIDSSATTITVVDLEHKNLAPQSNQIGRVYESIVNRDTSFHSIGGVDVSVIDDLSRWKDVARNNELFGRAMKRSTAMLLERIASLDSLGINVSDLVSGTQIINAGETQIWFPSAFDSTNVVVVPFVRRISDDAVVDFTINDIDSAGFDVVVWDNNCKLQYVASQKITHSSDIFKEPIYSSDSAWIKSALRDLIRDSASYVDGSGTVGYLTKFTGSKTIGNSIVSESSNQINVAGVINTTVDDVTVANKNKYRPLLSYNGTVIARFQDYYWNGSAYAADNSFGFGSGSLVNNRGAYASGFGVSSLANNSGAYSSGFGFYSLQNNSGANASGFGAYSLQYNSGANSSGFGYGSLAYNSGANSSGFGFASLASNSGTSSSGFGNASLQYNSGAGASGFGNGSLANNSGSYACGFGNASLQNNSGANSSGFGYGSLANNSGAYASGLGFYSLQNNSGANASGFGYNSLRNNSGTYASGFGFYSLTNNSGVNACGLGAFSLGNNSGANSSGLGASSLANNSGTNACGFGNGSLRYNNWANVTAIGAQSTNFFLDNPATDKIFDETCVNSTNKTITFPAPHGFGATNAKVNLRFTTLTGTAPGGLTTNTVYQFTITSATVLTYSGITSIGSEDFTGKLTNSVDINNSIAIGNDVNASKANQVVIGKTSITETQLFGKIGINSTVPDKQVEINSTTGAALRTTYNDADGSAVNFVDYSVTSSGDGAITPSGGDLDINAEVTKGIEGSKVPGVLFTQTADKTIANTTTETTLLGSGVGSLTIPANVLIAGKTIRIKLHGFISANTGVNSTVKVKIGSVELVTSTGSTPKAFSNTEFELSFTFTCRTSGATGTVIGQGGSIFFDGLGITSSYVRPLLMTAAATVNTTVSNTFDLTYTWGTADAGNSITCTNAIFEILN